MNNSVKINLRTAVQRLFVRLHRELLDNIFYDCIEDNALSPLNFDENNYNHLLLVKLCKDKIGFASIATNQDIYFTIMKVYLDGREKKHEVLPAAVAVN